MLGAMRIVVWRDLLVALRRRSDVGTVLLFFVIVVSLFPLGVGADPDQLRAIAPGVIWVAALLSSMLSLGRLFAADYADGTLEQMVLGAAPARRHRGGQGVCPLAGVGIAARRDRAAARPAVRPRRPGSTACLPYHCCWARRCSA